MAETLKKNEITEEHQVSESSKPASAGSQALKVKGEGQASGSSTSVQERNFGKSKTPNLTETVYRQLYTRGYQEVMKVAMDEYTWLSELPVLHSLREEATGFGSGIAMSTATATIPMPASDMVSMMMNVTEWEKSFSHIVYGSAVFGTGNALQFLQNEDAAIQNLVGVFTKVQLPTTFEPMWDFDFLRYLKEITPGLYAIVDVSINFFDFTRESNARLSGLIIRENGHDKCEIIWVDTAIVSRPEERVTIYSSIINFGLPISAGHWTSTLLWKQKRQSSAFSKLKISVHESAGPNLLEIAHEMKLFYKECVAQVPDNNMFEVYTTDEDEVRLMGIKSCTPKGNLDLVTCMCITSIEIKDKAPLSVFNFLVKKNLQLLFSSLAGPGMPGQVLEFATDDGSNTITLHRKKIGREYIYYLQEASRGEYCSFVISRPLTEDEVNTFIINGAESVRDLSKEKLRSAAVSGFAIMPNGLGPECGSLVTWVMQLNCDPITDFINSVNAVVNGIYETAEGVKVERSLFACIPFLRSEGNDG
ncbi:hypothetical protein COLO4_10576 [Corchorus olitorius]|uniref:Uncharacterized protein n=1 Tax=Corchorus olitorius TaxID=93759 RepID=A0A1R3K817_9ROSI|nr:hypothetical protein COLO4_10576 [Corchorus olitorius]